MYEDDKENKYYIGNILRGSGIGGFFASHRKLSQTLITLAILTVLLELYEGMFSAQNFFGTEQATLNPLKILLGTADHPVAALVMIIASIGLGSFISRLLFGEKVARYEENARGEIIDNTGLHGRGKIADEDEISRVFSLTSDYDTRGTIVGEQYDTGKVICKEWEATDFIEQLRNNHVLLAAPSSMGKTTNMILPNIISHMQSGHSQILFDPKGELYEDICPIAAHLGYKVRVLNMRTDEMSHSDGWDLLKSLREAEDPETVADDFCKGILKNLGGGKQDFWNNANINLLSLVLLYVTHAENFEPITRAPRYDENGSPMKPLPMDRVFKEVAAYIEDAEALSANVARAIEKDPKGDGRLLGGRYRTWSQNKEAVQIASGLSTALSIFRNQRVSEILSKDDISIDLLANDRTLIFVIPPLMSDAFKPITALFFMTAIDELIRIATKKASNKLDRMVYFFLEELPAIGEIPKLMDALNTVRGFGIGMMLCVQEISSLKGIYTSSADMESYKSIFGNCLLQICMGANYYKRGELCNAEYFSEISGQQTIREESSTEHRSKIIPEGIQEITEMDRSQTSRSSGVPVFLPDDILRIKGDQMMVKPFMHNAFMCKKFFWKRHPLSNICVRNRYTHEEHVLKTCDHIPHYISQSEDLFDTNEFEIYDKSFDRRFHRGVSDDRPHKPTSGVSYEELLEMPD